MHTVIISKVSESIKMFENFIEKLAKDMKFEARDSVKLKAITFVYAMTIGLLEGHEITLNVLGNFCRKYQGQELEITKQALHQRMEKGELLMNGLFNVFLNETKDKFKVLENIEVLKQFSDIEITDGTTVSLPDKLAGKFKGLGGTNAKAAFKMQTTYSVLKRTFSNLKIYDASTNDTVHNAEIIKELEPNKLYINDLGYFDKEYFSEIDKKNAYFLSRIKSNSTFYKYDDIKKDYEKLDWKDILKSSKNEVDTMVFMKLKSGEMKEVRLVGLRLPEDKINEKRRKINKKQQSSGETMKEREKLMFDWNLMITNVSADKLDPDTLYELYRLRWVIELIFKGLKSSIDFDKVGQAGGSYLMCLLYGKMIIALLCMDIYALCNMAMYLKNKRQVSIQGFLRNFRSIVSYFVSVILNCNDENLLNFYKELEHISIISLYEIRKRKTTEQRLMEKEMPKQVLRLLC